MDLRASTNRVLGAEIAEGGLSRRRRDNRNDLTDIVFSWSLHDISNENLYCNKVETIPETFQSVRHYLRSYVYPLLEETRASLCSSLENISLLPFTEVTDFVECKRSGNLYAVKVGRWSNESNTHGKETYKTLPGDILILTNGKLATVSDLERSGRRWAFASVRMIGGSDEEDEATSSTNFKVEALLDHEVNDSWKPIYAIFLINIATNRRIWEALHMSVNLDIVKNILCTDLVADEVSNLCITKGNGSGSESLDERFCHDLNESQKKAVGACLNKLQCKNKPSVELIWGPPGTGKTKTVAALLYTLLKRKHRTIVCAPTNVAIREVASRVLKLLKESDSGISTETESLLCYFGDMLIFGNKERLKVDSDMEEIYLEHRVDCVDKYFSRGTGWHQCLTSMIDTLANSVSQYHIFLEIEHTKRRKPGSDDDESECRSSEEDGNCELKSFLEFFRDRFNATVQPLRRCLYVYSTHISRTNFQNITSLLTLLDSFETLLFGEKLDSEEIEMTLSRDEFSLLSFEKSMCPLRNIYRKRQECLSMLLTVRDSLKDLELPNFTSKEMIADFCNQHASLIFCTASSSYKLYSVKMEPLNLLVIDEAAQLKECESVIPLQLPGVKHLILVGDECQLPAMVESEVSSRAGFGRSLFERLSSLGYSRQLLHMQYRMNPSISLFPTSNFYQNQILDGPNVKSKSYRKSHLPWPMFGPYSFINIPDGREQKGDDGCSFRNPVEVEVISRILGNLYRAWEGSEEDLTVGVISPYAAQVAAVQAKLGKKYENIKGFMVKVKSVDGFQGGEEDIVIISTVRSNSRGTIGFFSDTKRTNVALTRARYCLWILGNGKTLTKSKSVWEALIDDAKSRKCFFNVDEDKDLAKAILDVMKENNQLDVLLDKSSVLFRNARWKVLFSDNFLKSFRKLTSLRTKMSIILLLSRLSSGWRPKRGNVDIICEHSSHIVRQFKAEGLYVLCTIDIVKELTYIQILKIWDVLPLEDATKLVKRLDSIFETYSDDFISRCNEKCIEGDQEVPKTWVRPFDFVRYRSPSEDQFGSSSDADASDRRLYAENAKVSESLLLMKFYPLSSDVVRHLVDDSDGKQLSLPFEVTEQEEEIILFPRSTFILGRSGTGKTTVLTMKLFRNEKRHDEVTRGFQEIQSGISHSKDASLEISGEEIGEGAEDYVLRQLFVTVSAKLCFAVKQHVSQLRSSSISAKHRVESSSVNEIVDDAALFKDIPDSFGDLSPNSYPLIITFRKLLMMLDGTVGVSFFQRFPDLREFCHGQSYNSRAVALQSLLRAKEVTYEKFCAVYWPHFNDRIRRRLDPSRVFTEIMSHIKGGLQPADCCDGKLDRLAYVSLSEGRVSTLSIQRREEIYDAFEDYEKMKMKNGEFDLADLVNDLHRRIFREQFAGNVVDFVYIDEVQDLTMRQISLFKYICRNVDEGFVFSGDTAQTIARGIDFRFEDIRSVFYKEFLIDSMDGPNIRMEKGCLSKTFHLSQNFRTHAGILKLAQSVVDLLYHFFPLSVDALSPETSLICGEAPILLESENDESAILSIFGNSEVSGNFVGFGAEQVILVRDDHSRNEVSNLVRGQALVLTIVECKGLEFQDVLLYNFFGTSPLKSQWRVIYGYMKEQALLDNSSEWSSPSFNDTQHNILCSELKQLYVAITRTRQRLWICENALEFSKPMFDYWKKKCLIQVRLVDQALAEAMQVGSTPEEWKARGFKLLREGNYPMATMCFERARYEYGEKLAKASAFKADADLKHVLSPQEASNLRRQAAEIYEAIGVADSAAECFYMLKEYEKAGRIYMEKCGESALEKAGQCFSLAGRYSLAAEAYARGNIFSKCLSICAKGKLFEMGLQYIEGWKSLGNESSAIVKKNKEMEILEQDFLESCALHYYDLRDYKAMMKCVKAFHCIDSMRNLLMRLGCLDELINLEEDHGNFLEAARIVRMKGDQLGKSRQNKEASMKEYEKAGRIYMEKCGESALEKAGECFSLAGRYSLAAEAYARGNIFSKCLSICAKGELFEMGLQYIEDWKRLGNEKSAIVKKSKEIEKLEQDFLEKCALHYYDLRDYGAMMKYVKAFHCINSMRSLLMNLGCLDELISLEADYGNFLEAAKLVRMKGDIIREVDLLAKIGENKEASMHILWYVLFYSLWAPGSKGWPLKQFAQKEELLAKAKHLAKPEPIAFCEYVSVESSTLLDKQSSLAEMKELLSASRRNESVRGEILCARNILDFHLLWNVSDFCWEYDWVEYSEQQILRNEISVDSMVCFWNLWKEKIVRIIKCVGCAEMPGEKESRCCWEFCLNYFGVLEQRDNLQGTYHLLNADADWVRNIDKRFLQRNGQLVALELQQLVSAAQKYWYSELTSVGMKLLHKLDALYNFSVKSSLSNFWQSRCLALLQEVAKFLQELNYLNDSSRFGRALGNFIETSSRRYFGHIFPLDWRTSSTQDMISLRGSEASRHLLREMMNMRISKTHFSHGKMGELATLILGSGMLDDELYGRIAQSFPGNTSWKAFMECVCQDVQSDLPQASDDNKPVESSLTWNLYGALADTYKANWRIERDYITPICFLYLLERLLILLSCSKGKFYATKSSLVEWLICHEGLAKPSFTFNPGNCLEPIIGFVTSTIQQLLCNKGETVEWIKRSNLNVTIYYPLLVLKLVLLVCLLHLNFGIDPYFLIDLLGKSWVSEQLPPEFRRILLRRWRLNFRENSVGIIAEAFKKVDDPLVITNSAADCSTCPHAIILDVKPNKRKEEIMEVLFPKDGSAVSSCKSRDLTEVSKDSSSSCNSAAPAVHLDGANTSSLPEQETSIAKEEEKSEAVEAQKTSDVKTDEQDEQASSSSFSHTGVIGNRNKNKGNCKSNGKQKKKGRGKKK
ncbi:uncharacterized protein LOC115739970 isoform X2 [Rhodamnia argentea]|uniref:Uncharacterized protein LOC115739970 isoform X2 n=1 Tax=Rhodamnia argentea TaxID=178133 RepID=A0ABM3HFR3_9MYRT|nr:uncharacterized protein LOC115739970 isoform X2 [Rhodamnia argentea]